MDPRFGWRSDTPELFSATFHSPWGGTRHVVVEALPDGGWDWVAWAHGGRGQALHGRSEALELAMEAAEYSAALLAWAPRAASPVRRVLHEGHGVAI